MIKYCKSFLNLSTSARPINAPQPQSPHDQLMLIVATKELLSSIKSNSDRYAFDPRTIITEALQRRQQHRQPWLLFVKEMEKDWRRLSKTKKMTLLDGELLLLAKVRSIQQHTASVRISNISVPVALLITVLFAVCCIVAVPFSISLLCLMHKMLHRLQKHVLQPHWCRCTAITR